MPDSFTWADGAAVVLLLLAWAAAGIWVCLAIDRLARRHGPAGLALGYLATLTLLLLVLWIEFTTKKG